MVLLIEDRKQMEKKVEGLGLRLRSEDLEKLLKENPSQGHMTNCLGMTIYGIATISDFNNYLYTREINVEASIEPSKNMSRMNLSSS